MGLSLNMMLLWTNLFPLYFCFLFLIDGFSLTSSLLSFACLWILFCLIWSFLYFYTCHLWLNELFTSGAALDILGLKTKTKNICVCVCLCLCVCMCMFMCMCMCMCVYIYVHLYLWMFMYVCMFIYVYIYKHKYKHKHTYT